MSDRKQEPHTSKSLFLKKSQVRLKKSATNKMEIHHRRGWESIKGLYMVISYLFSVLYSFIGREQNADGCHGRRTQPFGNNITMKP